MKRKIDMFIPIYLKKDFAKKLEELLKKSETAKTVKKPNHGPFYDMMERYFDSLNPDKFSILIKESIKHKRTHEKFHQAIVGKSDNLDDNWIPQNLDSSLRPREINLEEYLKDHDSASKKDAQAEEFQKDFVEKNDEFQRASILFGRKKR